MRMKSYAYLYMVIYSGQGIEALKDIYPSDMYARNSWAMILVLFKKPASGNPLVLDPLKTDSPLILSNEDAKAAVSL